MTNKCERALVHEVGSQRCYIRVECSHHLIQGGTRDAQPKSIHGSSPRKRRRYVTALVVVYSGSNGCNTSAECGDLESQNQAGPVSDHKYCPMMTPSAVSDIDYILLSTNRLVAFPLDGRKTRHLTSYGTWTTSPPTYLQAAATDKRSHSQTDIPHEQKRIRAHSRSWTILEGSTFPRSTFTE